MKELKDYAIEILNGIGIEAGEDAVGDQYVSNQVTTKEYDVLGVKIDARVTNFGKTCRAEVTLSLPDDGILADTYIEHVTKAEAIAKNHHYRPCYGPIYRNYSDELGAKKTEAYSPWHNHYLCIWSEGYKAEEFEDAVKNCISLSRPFLAHLGDLASMRYWCLSDAEVVAKAKDIVANAALYESDCDREERAHYIRDEKSFFHGWFYPFNDHGRGTFDTLWPSSVNYAASGMGIEGSFEYAVASVLLEDEEFIRKARKACRIHQETITRRY